MNKIKKISPYFLSTFNFLIFFIPLFLVIQWIFIDAKINNVLSTMNFGIMLKTPEGNINLMTVAWTPMLKLLAFSADMINALPFLISLFCLKSLFCNYKSGEIFTVKNAILYRKLGVLYLIDGLLIQPLSHALLVLAVTLSNPAGHRYLSISFGTPNLSSLFYGTLVIIISWVMLEASKISDENKFTV